MTPNLKARMEALAESYADTRSYRKSASNIPLSTWFEAKKNYEAGYLAGMKDPLVMEMREAAERYGNCSPQLNGCGGCEALLNYDKAFDESGGE